MAAHSTFVSSYRMIQSSFGVLRTSQNRREWIRSGRPLNRAERQSSGQRDKRGICWL
jgi:hypothetical protein